jgi:hypothetical protein
LKVPQRGIAVTNGHAHMIEFPVFSHALPPLSTHCC